MAGWGVSGNVLIACNCDWGCPCNFNARPSRGFCEGGWIWVVDKGHVDDVVLDGLGLALFAKWPGAIHEGGGRAVCYLDDRADPSQRAALAAIARGERGGPWEIFGRTYALADPKALRFDVQVAEHASCAKVGTVVDLEFQAIRNPVTQAAVHPQVVLPEGLVVKHGNVAASKVFRVGDGLQFDHSGQYAAFGRFEYA